MDDVQVMIYNELKELKEEFRLYADKLYRFAVNFNINWLFTGKEQLHKDLVYNKLLYTFPYKEKR